MLSLRKSTHVVVAVLCWMLMIYMWTLLVMNSSATGHSLMAVGQKIAVMTAVVVVITLAWVRHNLRIFERKGARRGRPFLQPRLDVDRLGRRTDWEFYGGAAGAMDASLVLIETHGNQKRYRPGQVRSEP
ncbi:MAG: hypothetical protein M3506_05440 [Chloroflexota bacterium]|nr:hypothetical protein [Chloroflexota bacterium]